MKFEDLKQVADQYNIGKNSDGGWLHLETGDNKIRILSEYEVYAKHWINKKAQVCVGKDKGCAYCLSADTDKKEKPSVKFLLWVIDRRDGKAKIAEFGWTIIKAIADLKEDDEYAFDVLPEYDINVKKTVKGSGTRPSDTEYTVIAARSNTPLTDDELQIVSGLKPVKDIIEGIKTKSINEYKNAELTPEDPSFPEEPELDVPF